MSFVTSHSLQGECLNDINQEVCTTMQSVLPVLWNVSENKYSVFKNFPNWPNPIEMAKHCSKLDHFNANLGLFYKPKQVLTGPTQF